MAAKDEDCETAARLLRERCPGGGLHQRSRGPGDRTLARAHVRAAVVAAVGDGEWRSQADERKHADVEREWQRTVDAATSEVDRRAAVLGYTLESLKRLPELTVAIAKRLLAAVGDALPYALDVAAEYDRLSGDGGDAAVERFSPAVMRMPDVKRAVLAVVALALTAPSAAAP